MTPIGRIGQNAGMQIPNAIRYIALPLAALLMLVGCASGATAGWTYAPLGPSAAPSASAAAPSAAPGSGGPGTTLNVETTQDNPLVFSPAELTAPAGAQVTVSYMNNSNLPHNINFFNGPDSSAPSLGATAVTTGPNAMEMVTFTAPTQPGDYFFWCDVHQNAMKGILHVQ